MAEQPSRKRSAKVSPHSLRMARQQAGLPNPSMIGCIGEVPLPLNLLQVQRLQHNLDIRRMEPPWKALISRSHVYIFWYLTIKLNLDEWGDIWVAHDDSITLVGRISTGNPTSVSEPLPGFEIQDDGPLITPRTMHVFEEPGYNLEFETQILWHPRGHAAMARADKWAQDGAGYPSNTIQHSPATNVNETVDGQHTYALSPVLYTPGSILTNPWSPPLLPAPMGVVAERAETEHQQCGSNICTNKFYFPVYDRNFDVGVNPM